MSHERQYKEPDVEISQEEQAKRIRHTHLLKEILPQAKQAILSRLDYDEKNTPYEDRPESWGALLEEVIHDLLKKFPEISFEEQAEWHSEIKNKISTTEKEFLAEQGRTIREGDEKTIDSGMLTGKMR